MNTQEKNWIDLNLKILVDDLKKTKKKYIDIAIIEDRIYELRIKFLKSNNL